MTIVTKVIAIVIYQKRFKNILKTFGIIIQLRKLYIFIFSKVLKQKPVAKLGSTERKVDIAKGLGLVYGLSILVFRK